MGLVCLRGRSALGLIIGLAAGIFSAAVTVPAHAATPITVQVDRATLIKLPEQAATVVIGNPLIADMTVEPHGLGVVTGKGYGATNFIVLDKDGVVLAEHTVEVMGPSDPIVVVYRGVVRETYSCAPECLRRITLGDDPEYFDKTIGQSASRNAQAMAAGSQSAGNSGGGGGSATAAAPPAAAPPPPVSIIIQGGSVQPIVH
jgi:hypothetical protein